MEFRDIAKAVGVASYPVEMEAYYAPGDQTPACDIAMIDSLQKDYEMFGKYYDLVRQYAEKINADETRSAWVRTAVAFAKDGDFYQAKSVPVPKADGTLITSMLPFYILAAQIPDSLAEYRRRGFREEELEEHYKVYRDSLGIVENHTGLPGTNALYYGWDTHFVKCQIFAVGGLQYEMRSLPDQAVYLKEKATGRIIPVMTAGTFHKSGIQALGSAAYTDEIGAFACQFREDDENFYGHGCLEYVVCPQEQTFPKSEWECVMRPGDPCLGMHIPAKTDISQGAMNQSIRAAVELVAERFPEFSGRQVFCSSWLLDPQLGQLLGENSNITAFQNRFTRFPQKSAGMHVFGFVFPKRYDSFETLPEDSSLRRKLKKLYLDGGYIYGYAGVVF